MLKCPKCKSDFIKKNGIISTKKQRYCCKNCGKQFVEDPKNKLIPKETWELVNKLLLEKIPIAGISRVTGISEVWLQKYVNKKYTSIKKEFDEPIKKKISIIIECDEMWSFVGKKGNKYWIWTALDRNSRRVVGLYIGDRSRKGALGLWSSIASAYKETSYFYTDFWEAYNSVFPSNRHHSVGKETGLTNHIERFNNTMRQRCSRLVRMTLSFSKKVENHIGAIWYFIHHYNSILTI